jgi:hypothetical protein
LKIIFISIFAIEKCINKVNRTCIYISSDFRDSKDPFGRQMYECEMNKRNLARTDVPEDLHNGTNIESQFSGDSCVKPKTSENTSVRHTVLIQQKSLGDNSVRPKFSGDNSVRPKFSGDNSVRPKFSGDNSVRPKF